MNFDEFWIRAVSFLDEKIKEAGGELEMDNWSMAGKFRRLTIPITSATKNGITCKTADDKPIKATYKQLQDTNDKWDDYNNSLTPRNEMRAKMRRTTYTICTIHYLKKNLPSGEMDS